MRTDNLSNLVARGEHEGGRTDAALPARQSEPYVADHQAQERQPGHVHRVGVEPGRRCRRRRAPQARGNRRDNRPSRPDWRSTPSPAVGRRGPSARRRASRSVTSEAYVPSVVPNPDRSPAISPPATRLCAGLCRAVQRPGRVHAQLIVCKRVLRRMPHAPKWLSHQSFPHGCRQHLTRGPLRRSHSSRGTSC